MRTLFAAFLFSLTFCISAVHAEAVAPEAASPSSPEVAAEKSIPEKVVEWYAENLNYGTVALLMTVESSFIPFPSEVVVPPAAYAACDPESSLYVTDNRWVNIGLVIVAATVGALFGALINYYLALFFGRPLINWFAESRLGSLCLIDREKIEKSEMLFRKYGISSTFFGRLIPVVRQLISLPAGVARMRMLPFVIFTSLGAMIWNIILAVVGYYAHGQQEIINRYSRELSWGILICAAVFGIYLAYKFLRGGKRE